MIVLGLDIATTTGWCRLDTETGAAEWGRLDLSPQDADEPEGVRLLRLADRLPEVLDGVASVGIEQTFSRNFRTAQILYGLAGVALVELERRGLPYAFIPAATLKKWATGNGNASKDDMRERFLEEVEAGGEVGSDEVDAYWIARWIASVSIEDGI